MSSIQRSPPWQSNLHKLKDRNFSYKFRDCFRSDGKNGSDLTGLELLSSGQNLSPRRGKDRYKKRNKKGQNGNQNRKLRTVILGWASLPELSRTSSWIARTPKKQTPHFPEKLENDIIVQIIQELGGIRT